MTNKQKLKAFQVKYYSLRKEYNDLVLPYGLGHDIPEATSLKATRIMETAHYYLKQIKKLEKVLSVEKKPPPPNAHNLFNLN